MTPKKPPRRAPAKSPFKPANPLPATDRQKLFIRAVAELTHELGRPPSAHEVGARIGVSRTGAQHQLKNLEDKGLLTDMPRIVSSGKWQLTETGEAELASEE